jgi:hypothetical protein
MKMGASEARKEAIRKFKERKTPRGIFAVRCAATGTLWVGSSRNLDAAKNGFWFGLRIGSHLDKSLQSEWNAHGEQAFAYEVLETLKDDVHPLELADLLKERQRHWMTRLDARGV